MINNKVIIAVCITCYNHEKFIAQAIESALSQALDSFYVKIYIGEDCSPDHSRIICREYAEKYNAKIVLVENEANLGLCGNTINLFNRIISDGCQYIAMLDGDDYWIDDKKLQTQISFLQDNSDYGLVFTNACISNGTKLTKMKRVSWDGYKSVNKAAKISIPNNTVVFRASLLSRLNLDDFLTRNFMSLDYSMYIIFSQHTKFKYFPIETAVWRRGHASVSNTKELDKQIKYINNDIAQWSYISFIFPNEIAFSDRAAEKYRNYVTFKLAYKYCDFKLANKLSKDEFVRNYSNRKTHKIKVACAKIHLLFILLHIFNKILNR